MEEKKRRRWLAGFLAVIMTITGVGIPLRSRPRHRMCGRRNRRPRITASMGKRLEEGRPV